MEARWYGSVSDGGFLDLIDELGRVGASCAGEHPARCAWRGVRFALVHDAEGPVRAYIDDAGPLGSAGAWAMLDSVILPVTHRTGIDLPPWASSISELGQQAWQEYGPQVQQLGQQLGQQAWQQYGPQLGQQFQQQLQQQLQQRAPVAPTFPVPTPAAPTFPVPTRQIGKGVQRGLPRGLPFLPQMPELPSFEQLSRGIGRGIGEVLPNIPEVGPSLQRGARELGQQLGQAGKEIAQSLPVPSFHVDLEKPAERIAQAMKTIAVIAAVAIVGSVTVAAIARR